MPGILAAMRKANMQQTIKLGKIVNMPKKHDYHAFTDWERGHNYAIDEISNIDLTLEDILKVVTIDEEILAKELFVYDRESRNPNSGTNFRKAWEDPEFKITYEYIYNEFMKKAKAISQQLKQVVKLKQ